MNKIKYVFSLAFFAGLVFYISGCQENPTSLGLNYIPPGDTIGTALLDSQTDSMDITGYTKIKYINNYYASTSFIGQYQNYTARTLLRFFALPITYDSASVLSARLKIRFNNYYFRDSLGTVAFNIYPLNDSITYSSTTLDNFNNSIIGSQVLASYSGNFTDTTVIDIPFDTSIVRKWLWLAENNTYPFHNSGMIFVPAAGCTNIKGFINCTLTSIPDSLKPQITAIVLKNGVQDTLTFPYSESTNLTDAPLSVATPNRFFVNSGIALRTVMNLDISKLPHNVTVNQAILTLKLDKPNSFIFPNSDQRIGVSLLTDTSTMATDGYTYYSASGDSLYYNIIITPIIQRWNFNTANLGVVLSYIYEYQQLNMFSFFKNNDPVIDNRPRLKIRYTPRTPPASVKNNTEISNGKKSY